MKAMLVDDEPLLTQSLKTQLAALWPELEIVGIAHSSREALALLDSVTADVVFLDIHMPGMSGLELAAQLPRRIRIVFVTAFDQYAVEAFQRAAVDYLLKPVLEERLQETIKRLRVEKEVPADAMATLLASLSEQPKRYLQWLKVSQGDVTELIGVNDVVYFKSSQKYTEVYTANQSYLIRQSIRDLEGELDPDKFWRIHRGLLVQVDQIQSANKDFGGKYKVQLKSRPERLTCSKSYGFLFKQS